MTALQLLQKADVQSGQKVLVYGASGSVGTYGVQLARHFGAKVTGVCSSRNVDLVKSLGADEVIDYTREEFSANGEAYDVIFDAVGKISPDYKRALKEKGAFVSVKSPTSEKIENLVFLRKLAEAGAIEPVIDRRYPLQETAEAHRYVESGRKSGNVVITVDHD
jgi:NADPH:quinone reductase-like Zn-dependent oxidoreductase